MYAQYIKFKTCTTLTSLKDISKIDNFEIRKIKIRTTKKKVMKIFFDRRNLFYRLAHVI